jgi:hypothetical protein
VTTYLPMIALATVLIFAIGGMGWWILNNWRTSRRPTDQIPPEIPTRRWLRREARNARAAARKT